MIPVLGMHRSGTSALAGALHKLGGELGTEADWITPAADNPLGFFEFERVVAINRAVLAAFGGTWSSPPPLPPGWTSDDRIAEQRELAERFSAEQSARLIVKDPRLSLVLPMWDAVADALPAVLCLRHPWAVAQSLHKRNEFSLDEGLVLWFRYTAAAALCRPDAMLLEYERLLIEPEIQLARVVEHLEIDASERSIAAAAHFVRDSMAHNAAVELPSTPIGEMCGVLYELLRDGQPVTSRHDVWLWAKLVTELPWAGPSDREITIAQRARTELEREVRELTAINEKLTARCQRIERDLRRATTSLDRSAIEESATLLPHLKDDLP